MFLTAVWLISVGFQTDQALYLSHLRFLASDQLAGRGNGQPELDLAAEYIAHWFREYGLLPAGEMGTYFQTFEVAAGYRQGPENALSFYELPFQPSHLQLGTDYWPLTYGGEAVSAAEVVFAGFGISAPEYNYDDYQELDVRGKVVVVFEHEPREHSEKSPFAGRDLTIYATPMSKIVTAKQRGAAAVILIPDSFNHTRGIESLNEQQPVIDLGISAVRLSAEWGARIIELSGRDSREIRRWLNGHLTPYSFQFDHLRCALQLDFEKIMRPVRNVVAVVPGQTEEVILLGAHYDHLGLGGQSSLAPEREGEIHNGADDNASGTAGLLHLARKLAGAKPRNTLVFAAFAGEELGLLGSRHFAERTPLLLEKTTAMLNMDMIGRSRGELLVGGVGTATEFRPFLESIQKSTNLSLRLADTPRGSSDHLSFVQQKIPVLFFFSGLHGDYHKPTDDWEKIDTHRSMQVLDVIQAVVEKLDEHTAPLTYVDLSVEPDPRVAGANRGYGPLFGSIPDMQYQEGGVRFADVQPQSPAARAGLKTGDILVRFGEIEIDTLYDFTFALRARSAGEPVEVVVLRNGQRITTQVVLQERK